MAEAGAAIACHVAADHTFAQACLECLTHHAAIYEILGASLENLVQRHLLRRILGRIEHASRRRAGWPCLQPDLPDALTAVATITFDHARAGSEPRWQFGTHRL